MVKGKEQFCNPSNGHDCSGVKMFQFGALQMYACHLFSNSLCWALAATCTVKQFSELCRDWLLYVLTIGQHKFRST
jgi:hypothetical protein